MDEKDEALWRYHAEHLPRWAAEHRKRLDHWADDSKFEQRPVPSFSKRRELAARKYRNRMSSACHEAAAQLVGYAKRRRFAAIELREDTHEFCESLPWFRLRQLIGEKANFNGIDFSASGQAAEDSPEALAKEDGDEESKT